MTSARTLTEWDPLFDVQDDPGMIVAAQKRNIRNILKSYTGYYDLFSEMIQNALDAVERRVENESGYQPAIWITIDIPENTVAVTDNGCGMDILEFRSFLKPNYSFKDGVVARGSKGVGATYLAYGFNHLEVATRSDSTGYYSGVLRNGRNWLDDNAGVVNSPKVVQDNPSHVPFMTIDKGTSMKLHLSGETIRPKDLSYFRATTAEQWLCILRAHTPLGGIYLCETSPIPIDISVEVISGPDKKDYSKISIGAPRYLYPHEVLGKTADLREFLKDQATRASKAMDLSKIPAKFTNLNGIWGEWTGVQIFSGSSPIKPRLSKDDEQLLSNLEVQVYVFQAFSTDLWDDYNDKVIKLRKGARILRGGLIQATRHMPQGSPITIPLTENIGYQNITHIIVHFQDAEPDLGRKGFQPELTKLAERISVSAVTAFKKYYSRLLRKKTGAVSLLKQMQLSKWIDEQKEHELACPLTIKGAGLFAPEEELPIRSTPRVEQDVVALFNQMLSAGVIRGIHLLASSQFKQYDGLYRVRLVPPFTKFVRDAESNPLGVDSQIFAGIEQEIESPVRILEYKYSLDALIEEFMTGEKNPDDIGLAVTWEMGDKWRLHFDVISYLDPENTHHRQFHGFTHSLSHSVSGNPAFQVIVLKELISYLMRRPDEEKNQQQLYS